MGDADEAMVWKATDWRAALEQIGLLMTCVPNNEKFKAHFEATLNILGEARYDKNDAATDVIQPARDESITVSQL